MSMKTRVEKLEVIAEAQTAKPPRFEVHLEFIDAKDNATATILYVPRDQEQRP